ncbi:cbb3-type cytochrome c oxidase subunit II [Geminisphaera colitermitum]|uniref:cbb3-type cytochrome c oxidase subunit II n=1 Tax=Geminisphaera colitermitum TaxID=1148786 RepID=UPI000158C7E3|nr:cbb3-type cytochrome c oxidase subunit II [Geminisphaera colitermitum]
MNRAPLLFLGIFVTLAFSWTGIVLTNQISYGKLTPVRDDDEGKSYPLQLPGAAARGKEVYREMGCVYCHTQQVRRPGYGVDIERGWGERQSVARDYIREQRVYLGTMRTGPDLRNVGARYAGQGGIDWHMKHLYDPVLTSPGSIMQPYRFLFDYKPVVGEPSAKAIDRLFTAEEKARYGLDKPGYELVPSQRAQDLVQYLLSLNDSYTYPEEARRVYVEPPPPKTDKPADATAQPADKAEPATKEDKK